MDRQAVFRLVPAAESFPSARTKQSARHDEPMTNPKNNADKCVISSRHLKSLEMGLMENNQLL